MLYANQSVQRHGKIISLAKAWLESDLWRTYYGITFQPGVPRSQCAVGDSDGPYFNHWQGFAVEPHEGDRSIFLDHIRTNVCHDDPYRLDWVIGWLANIVQRPREKPGTALVLRGMQGVGKT